jgi:hypothetical protein
MAAWMASRSGLQPSGPRVAVGVVEDVGDAVGDTVGEMVGDSVGVVDGMLLLLPSAQLKMEVNRINRSEIVMMPVSLIFDQNVFLQGDSIQSPACCLFLCARRATCASSAGMAYTDCASGVIVYLPVASAVRMWYVRQE